MVIEENTKADYRYPGPRPFYDNDIDRLLFFGRDKEIETLLYKVLADNLAVLYARSGLGKTSLLNAGLSQPLREWGFIPLMVRLNDPTVEPVQRIYAGIKEIVSQKRLEVEIGEEASLWQYFKTTYFWSETNKILKPVLILDHFEEFFSLYSPSSREDFTRQLADIVDNKIPVSLQESLKPGETLPYNDNPLDLKIIISIREDYLGQLDEMCCEIPDILHRRFRLLPLSREQAREAIIKPAQVRDESILAPVFDFATDAVEMMLDYLCKRKEWGQTKITDEVESTQLQLLCRNIEGKVHEREAKEVGNIIVEKEVLGGEPGMKQVFQRFYDDLVEQLDSPAKKENVRKLCQEGLISFKDLRLSLEEGEIESKFNVSKELLKELVNRRLLRAEPRVGSFYYELSHDTLVAPIRESQKEQNFIFRLYEEAGDLKTKSNYEDAIQKYKAIIEIDKTYVDAYLELGQTFYEIYQYSKAVEIYEQAIENGIKDALIYYRLGNVFVDTGKIEEAIQHFEASLQIDPNLSMPYEALGDIYTSKNNFKKAVESYTKALTRNIKKADTYRKLAVSHIKNGEPGIAIEVFQEAIKVNPGYVDIYDKIAEAFKKNRFNEYVEKITDIASRSGTQKASHYFNFGNNYTELKKYDQAIKNYQKAIDLDPKYTSAYSNMGFVLNNQRKYKEAVELLNKAIELDPKNSQSYNNKGYAFKELKRYDEALAAYLKVIEIDPKNSLAYINMVSILKKLERYYEAITVSKEALKIDPQNYLSLRKMGLTYDDLKKYNKAIAAYQNASNDLEQSNDSLAAYKIPLKVPGKKSFLKSVWHWFIL
jgi:tetratricopeptide (TPR) repeat protein